MKKIYFILSFIFTLNIFPFYQLQAQNNLPDNKGEEFWLMFNRNFDNTEVNLKLIVSAELPTSGYVVLPDASILDFQVFPGKATTIKIPSEYIASLEDGIEKKGIKVVAEHEISVYGLNQKSSSTDAFLGLPVDVLGEEYIVMSTSSYDLDSTSSPVLGVVATMNNTALNITPSSKTKNRESGVPFQILLQQGESYQLVANEDYSDLTGTLISSNKPVAVFGGHTCGNVPLLTEECGVMVEQMAPLNTLGKNFITVPLLSREDGDVFRVLSTKDGTTVKVNGSNGFSDMFSLDKGEYKIVDIPSDVYSNIVSNHGILVAQLSKGKSPDNISTDPLLMLVPPIEQYQNQYIVSTPETGFAHHYINLSIPISQKDKVRFDGSFIGPSFFEDIPNSNYAGAQIEVGEGIHRITADLPFGVFMYGFDKNNSYGFPGGQALAKVAKVQGINLVIVEEEQEGSTYCVKALVTDQSENPILGVKVDFDVQGPNEEKGFGITDEKGFAHFCFEADVKATDKLIARVNNTTLDTVVVMSDKPVPSTITFLEYVVNGIVGEEICLNGTVLDQFGIPISDAQLSVAVNGVFSDKVISDENGKITFCQIPDEVGDLIVTVYYEDKVSTEATITVGLVSEDMMIDSFLLIDAGTNTVIGEIKDNDIIPYSAIKGKMISLKIVPTPEVVGSVKMEMSSLTQCATCPIEFHSITENIQPYALYGDIKGKYVGKNFFPGKYELTATPFEFRSNTGNQGVRKTINFEVFYEENIESFTLVNATDDKDILTIKDGATIDLSLYNDKKFNIRANVPIIQKQGGVLMELDGPVSFSQFEKIEPLALFTDVSGDYTGKTLPEGNYSLSATAYPFNSSVTSGIGGETFTIGFEVIHQSKIDHLTLVNADTDKDIKTLMDGSYLDLNQFKDVKLNVRADVKGEHIGAITFQLSGEKNYTWTERKAPYAIFGDSYGLDYNGKYLEEGSYRLMVTPYNKDNKKGKSITINFEAGYSGNNLRISRELSEQKEEESSFSEAEDNFQSEDLIVYPQPSRDLVNIDYPSFLNEDAMVLIYKGNGQLIQGSQLGNTPSFNFGNYGSGLYLIQVSYKNKIISKKVWIY